MLQECFWTRKFHRKGYRQQVVPRSARQGVAVSFGMRSLSPAGADSVVWSLRFPEGTREAPGASRHNPRRKVPSADRRRSKTTSAPARACVSGSHGQRGFDRGLFLLMARLTNLPDGQHHKPGQSKFLSVIDRDRGSGCPPAPPTPPCVRVRTRRFGGFS